MRNHNHPETCIVESYIAEKVVESFSEYIEGVETIGIPKPR